MPKELSATLADRTGLTAEELLRAQITQGKSPKAAVEAVAGALGVPKRRVYQLMLGLS